MEEIFQQMTEEKFQIHSLKLYFLMVEVSRQKQWIQL